MKKQLSIFLAFLILAAFWLQLGSNVALAQRRPPPKPIPHANIAFEYTPTPVSPTKLSRGVEMTYTFELINRDGATAFEGRDVLFELPFIGNQQFVSYETDKPEWALIEPVTNTVRIDINKFKINDHGKIIIHAKFATNFERTVLKQAAYVSWVDTNGPAKTSRIMTIEVDLSYPAPPSSDPTPPAPPEITPQGPFAPVNYTGQKNSETEWYIPSTRHIIRGAFLDYWQTHGSVLNLGYPLSEEFYEDGLLIQYYERVVLEYHPDNPPEYQVLLRALGRELGRVQDTPASSAPETPGSIYFPETGQWLDGNFVELWRSRGGLAQFGYPVSPPYIENNKFYQWTERARFELDISRPAQLVTLGRLGAETAISRNQLPPLS